MSVMKSEIESALARVSLPDGKSLLAHDLIRALTVEGGTVRFVIEAPSAEVVIPTWERVSEDGGKTFEVMLPLA